MHFTRVQYYNLVYSKTSNNGPSDWKRKTCTADDSLAPDWFYYRTNTLRTSEKRIPLNSEQRTLVSPRRTQANTKLPPKTDSEATPDIMRTLVNRFRIRNANVAGFKDLTLY